MDKFKKAVKKPMDSKEGTIKKPVKQESSTSGQTPHKKKKQYKHLFLSKWLDDPDFKDWVSPVDGDRHSAYCRACDSTLVNTKRTGLLAHKRTSKHQRNFSTTTDDVDTPTTTKTFNKKAKTEPSVARVQGKVVKPSAAKTQGKLKSLVDKQVKMDNLLFTQDILKQVDDIADQVAKAEIMFSAFITEHDTPSMNADHLLECMKNMFPDSPIASQMALKRTNPSYVIQEGVSYEHKQNISSICRRQHFSVLIDEITDISISQILAIIVRYYDEAQHMVVDTLFELVEVDDVSGLALYTTFKTLLEERQIPLGNLIGFGCDECAIMTGINGEFQKHLRVDVPNIFVIGCICHSFTICANIASHHFPSWLETLVKDVCFYFSRSGKKNHSFSLIQDIVQSEVKQVTKLCETRWISREAVVNRILEQWDALLQYFNSLCSTDEIDGAAHILQRMNTVHTKHMLLFLSNILNKVNNMNIEFQSENVRLHKLYSSITSEYRSILAMFISEDVISNSHSLYEIDPHDSKLYKSLNFVDVGGRCAAHLLKHPLGDRDHEFRSDVLKFLIELCVQIRARFPLFDDSVLAKLQVLDPKYATEKARPSLIPLAVLFPTVVDERNLDELEDQWRSLCFAKESLSHLLELEPPVFWSELKQVKNNNQEATFGILCDFMCALLVLPHSSASAERFFSQVNVIKNKYTNRLHCHTLANKLIAKEAIRYQNACCYTWMPSESLVEDVKEKRCHMRYIDKLLTTYTKEEKIEHNQSSVCDVDLYILKY